MLRRIVFGLLAGVLSAPMVIAQAAPAQQPPAAAQAAPAARTFANDGGMVLNFIKPDKTADFEAVVAMRERTPFPKALVERLPKLKLLVTTGMRNASIDVAAALADGVVEAEAADHRAHRAFGHLADGLVGLRHLKEVELRRADVPPHRVSEVQKVLVARQHQVVAFGRSEIDRADVLDVDLRDPVDRRGQGEPDAGA